MNNIAIIAVTYNRIDSLQRLLNSLEKAYYGNERPTLIISIDKSDSDNIEVFADDYNWPLGEKIVRKHDKNLGLRNHMMSLGKWFNEFETLVILEDDIVVSPCFFSYVQQTTEKYKKVPEVAGISLYGFEVNYQTGTPFQPVHDEHDVYFMNCAMSWGEVWMKESWNLFYQWYENHLDFEKAEHLPDRICSWGKKSWLKYHTRYCIEENKYFVHPYVSLSTNYADAGEHNNVSAMTAFQTNLQQGNKTHYSLPDIGEGVYYDGFFENKDLYKALDLNETNCCLDLYGTQRNRMRIQYWLTTEKQNLPIVKSFGIRFRPLEMNVINNVSGNDIFLYESNSIVVSKQNYSTKKLLYRYHVDDVFIFAKRYGLVKLLKDIVIRLFK